MFIIKQSKANHWLPVLLLVLGITLAEIQRAQAEAGETSSKKISSSTTKKVPKIKRTIRLVEPEATEAEPKQQQQQPMLSNVGSSNKVDVNPTISLNAPAAPASEESEDHGADASQLQIVPIEIPKVQAAAQPQDQQLLKADSGNQLMDVQANNNNVLSRLLTNSGQREELHIDGVGNQKVTRISNVGNTEEHHEVNAPAKPQSQPQPQPQPLVSQLGAQLPLGPLVSISMNNEGLLSAATKPTVPLALVPQMFAPTPYASPFAPMMMQANSLMTQQPPMMMMSTFISPNQWSHLMQDLNHQQHHHHHHHHHHEKCKHKALRKKQKKDKKEKKQKKVVVEELRPEPKIELVEKKVAEPKVELVKPQQIVLKQVIEPTTTTTTAKPIVVEPEDEEEEVIEWETVRVPKKRMVLKAKKTN